MNDDIHRTIWCKRCEKTFYGVDGDWWTNVWGGVICRKCFDEYKIERMHRVQKLICVVVGTIIGIVAGKFIL